LQSAITRIDSGRCVALPVSPKACTTEELFGWLDAASGRYHDGILAKLFRDYARQGAGAHSGAGTGAGANAGAVAGAVPGAGANAGANAGVGVNAGAGALHPNAGAGARAGAVYPNAGAGAGTKWVVLDGRVDPCWVESLNSTMDDSKVLTLVSNERIALAPSVRILLEVSSLDNASPSTVSRTAMLYICPRDVGRAQLVSSWIHRRERPTHLDGEPVAILEAAFAAVVPCAFAAIAQHHWTHVTRLCEVGYIDK